MSKGNQGSATSNSATVPMTAEEITRMINGIGEDIKKSGEEHDKRMAAYGDSTVKLIKTSTDSVNATIEKTGQTVIKTIAADGAETRKAMLTSHKVTNDKLDTLVHRTKTTLADILISLALGTAGFFAGWKLAELNTTLFQNKLAFGVFGFVLAGALTILIISVVRGLYRKNSSSEAQEAPASSPKPEPKPEPVEAQPEAKKPEQTPTPKKKPETVPDKKPEPASTADESEKDEKPEEQAE